MNNFPVKKLKADIIELGGKLLVNENGDLAYDGKILARYEDLVKVYVISSQTDMNFLTPNVGDTAKRTDTGFSYIWNGVWIPISRSNLNVYTVSSEIDLDLLNPLAGDFVNITDTYTSAIFDGNSWNNILTGITGSIDDAITSSVTTWSSTKIDYIINTHNHDGGGR